LDKTLTQKPPTVTFVRAIKYEKNVILTHHLE